MSDLDLDAIREEAESCLRCGHPIGEHCSKEANRACWRAGCACHYYLCPQDTLASRRLRQLGDEVARLRLEKMARILEETK